LLPEILFGFADKHINPFAKFYTIQYLFLPFCWMAKLYYIKCSRCRNSSRDDPV